MTEASDNVRRAWPVRRAALVGAGAVAVFVALGLAAPGLSPDGVALRLGILSGTAAGGLGGALGLFLMSRAAGKPFNELLLAQLLGFLARILLVAAGLVVVQRLDGSVGGFVVSFFFLFFLTTALEALLVRPGDRSSSS